MSEMRVPRIIREARAFEGGGAVNASKGGGGSIQ